MANSIEFQQVSKRYRLGAATNFRELIGGIGKFQKNQFHWAVKDVSFQLKAGESLGIIGPNGAGKTTILKLLSKITYPTSGAIKINGRFAALIELGAGFHPELSGRENIFLNGTILGMKRSDIKANFDQIVDFAQIGDYLDTPVKRYSSGMYARLGFAIAAHLYPDVFLVDEVLAVGDYAFRMKCYKRMNELREMGTTLIFVSHNMEDVLRVCDKGIVMFRGKEAFSGDAKEAVAEYSNVLRQNASAGERQVMASGGLSQRRMTHGAKIEKVMLVGEDGQEKKVVQSGETVNILVEVRFYEDAPSPVFAPTLFGNDGEIVYDTTTRVLGIQTPDFKAGDHIVVKYKLDMHLLDGVYNLATDLAYTDLSCYYDYFANAITFLVTSGNRAKGIANLNAEVSFNQVSSDNDQINLGDFVTKSQD
jgi:ABC-type polysaccharide/polyol phosphate transport system ATPase subunit